MMTAMFQIEVKMPGNAFFIETRSSKASHESWNINSFNMKINLANKVL